MLWLDSLVYRNSCSDYVGRITLSDANSVTNIEDLYQRGLGVFEPQQPLSGLVHVAPCSSFSPARYVNGPNYRETHGTPSGTSRGYTGGLVMTG